MLNLKELVKEMRQIEYRLNLGIFYFIGYAYWKIGAWKIMSPFTELVWLFVKQDKNFLYLYSYLAHILNDVSSPFLIQTFFPICIQC